MAWIEKILLERELHFPYKPLEISSFTLDGIKMAYVFYENGLAVNVMYTLAEEGKRAVGFKLSDGMAIPAEFEGKFKFARQKSKIIEPFVALILSLKEPIKKMLLPLLLKAKAFFYFNSSI